MSTPLTDHRHVMDEPRMRKPALLYTVQGELKAQQTEEAISQHCCDR
ncbi:MAG: hypothetical protein JOZ71_04580 [Ktedonobacteraceae bacterium]|nr:hypothetical protein [Ktedonobacteraceae bacterium]